MKGIYTRERFTDEEVETIEIVSNIVCEMYGISLDDLRSSARNFPLPDARKIVSHYICNNLELEKVSGFYNVALPTWYLNRNHTSITYYVNSASELYESDSLFRKMYDKLLAVLSGAENSEYSLPEKEVAEKKYTWEQVRCSNKFSFAVKEMLLPKKVAYRMIEMYNMGYSFMQIKHYSRAGEPFVRYFLRKHGGERSKIKLMGFAKSSPVYYNVSSKAKTSTVDY